MTNEQVRRRLTRQHKTQGPAASGGSISKARNDLEDSSSMSQPCSTDSPALDDAHDQDSSPPTTISTPEKSEKTTGNPSTNTPKSKKRKSRTAGYGDSSDSDYRAHTSSRKSSRRSRRASFDSDPDGDYGGSLTPTRTMTRPIKVRYSHRKLIKDTNSSDSEAEADNEEDEEDEREGLCLKTCPYYETKDMVECDAEMCGGRKFHLGCVGFRAMPVLGDRACWFCFECRKALGMGMRNNGIYIEGEENEGDG